MTALERIANIRHTGEFKIEEHHIGYAINFYGMLTGGTPYFEQVYYVSNIYAKPKGDARQACLNWAEQNGIEIAA